MENKFKLYNTLTKSVDLFQPFEDGKVKLYTCGPTVYHFAHIGNLRSYIMEDLLEKALGYAGYKVTRAMNITDVGHLANDSDNGEDKMVAGAKREHKSVMEIADFYKNAFFEDCKMLNIKTPEIVVPATSCIDDYIKLISALLEKDFAYEAGGNIYFDTSKLNDYYCLTGHTNDENLSVAVRGDVEEDNNKKNKTDFVLWFTKSKFVDQELRWESPWGVGYPGWHIECSAISIKNLGEYLDIHCGGIDNIFPHHTNEIAQSEAVLGHQWCKHWFHVQHLITKNGKMSKSSGEFLTLSLLKEKGYDPLAYRFFCLQSHYRKPLTFSYENLDNTVQAYNKLKEKIAKLKCGEEQIDNEVFKSYKSKFLDALQNDLNTSLAFTVLYDVFKHKTNDATKLALVRDFDKVLSLNLDSLVETNKTSSNEIHSETDDEFAKFVETKIEERKNAKQNKNFALADQIRNELLENGVVLVDKAGGITTWSKNN